MTTFQVTPIAGVLQILSSPYRDKRGSFLNLYRLDESVFDDIWPYSISQANISSTETPGTIRGLHMQRLPYSEAKLVRCISGAVWDVVADLRPTSETFGHWHSIHLSAASSNAILVPPGCAHGFQVLEPNSQLLYFHSGHWRPDFETGIRFDDASLAIPWPLPHVGLSDRDMSLPSLSFYQ